jgi:hypothetical protein
MVLTIAGAGLIVYLLFFAAGWRGWMVMAGGAMFAGGICWLWFDFIEATPNEELKRDAP